MSEVDLPLDEAFESLTGFEIIQIQLHYGEQIESLGGIRSLCGAVWAYENRGAKTPWTVVENRTMKELSSYFAEPDLSPGSDQDLVQSS